MAKNKYIAILTLLVLGQELHVGFKKTGFRFPKISDDPLDIESMVKHDQQLMDQIQNADANEKPTLVSELQLPPLVAPYIETGNNLFLDILSKEDFVEETVETSKLDLTSLIKLKNEEIAQLKAVNQTLENEKASLTSQLEQAKTQIADLQPTESSETEKTEE